MTTPPPSTSPSRPPKVPRPEPVPRVRSARIDRLDLGDVAAFWDSVEGQTPLLEAAEDPTKMVITFVWRGESSAVEAVLLFANRLTDETSLADTLLEHKAGTDLWHASFLMDADWRASYSFLVHQVGEPCPWKVADQVAIRGALDAGHPDPRNPLTCRNRAGILQSVAQGPAAPSQDWLDVRPGIERGTLTPTEGPGGRRLWIYQPPGATPAEPLDLLVAFDGEVWAGHQDLATTLDNLAHDGLVRTRAVLVDSGGRDARWDELSSGGSGAGYVVNDLLPWVREHWATRPGAGAITVAGQSLGGLTALKVALEHPEAVAGVISHSASLWQEKFEGRNPAPGQKVFLAHGTQEWVLVPPHRDLAQRWAQLEAVDFMASSHNGGHDYAWWRSGIAEGLVWVHAL